MGRPKKTTTTQAETTGGYFRRVFKEYPKLLGTRSNDEVLARWLCDHPGEKEVPANIKNHLANVKGILRKKGRKKRRKAKTVEQNGAVQAISTPPKPTRIAPKGLEGLEEIIVDCLTAAKNMDREGLLRNARNGVVWKLGR
jgi:hypothetical protein